MGNLFRGGKRREKLVGVATYSLKNEQPISCWMAWRALCHYWRWWRYNVVLCLLGLRGIGALQKGWANGRREQRMVRHTVHPIKHGHGPILGASTDGSVEY